jgi:branched-subunit amino acid aminotransferase/4-amino-4-deoxychorismate lyase
MMIDGVISRDGMISAMDMGFTRGVGVFEVARAYQGRLLGLDRHLARLARSAELMDIPLAPLKNIRSWMETTTREGGDCMVRVLCTPGDEGAGPVPRTVVQKVAVPDFPDVMRLSTTVAHWHPAGADWGLSGVKSLSYAPNMTALFAAKKQGFDDTLLLSLDGVVLECPRSSVGWVRNGVIEFPSLELGILDSVTRQYVVEMAAEAGMVVETGFFDLAVLGEASEVFILSTAREVAPVVAVDDRRWEAGPVTAELAMLFDRRVQEELSLT